MADHYTLAITQAGRKSSPTTCTVWMCVIGLLTLHAGLLAWSATRHSPTLNEPGHLVAGISYWKFGRFELYRVNPPLVKLIAALPVMAAAARCFDSRTQCVKLLLLCFEVCSFHLGQLPPNRPHADWTLTADVFTSGPQPRWLPSRSFRARCQWLVGRGQRRGPSPPLGGH